MSKCFCDMCVYVCIWWARTGLAEHASPNIVWGQTGPIATHGTRPWAWWKSLDRQKPQQIFKASWTQLIWHSSREAGISLNSRTEICRKESEDQASIDYMPNSQGQCSVLALVYKPLKVNILYLYDGWAVGHCLLLASWHSSMHLSVMNRLAYRHALLRARAREMF